MVLGLHLHVEGQALQVGALGREPLVVLAVLCVQNVLSTSVVRPSAHSRTTLLTVEDLKRNRILLHVI